MMRSAKSSLVTTGTSLIIVGRLHAFKTAAQFLSALAEKFQLRRKQCSNTLSPYYKRTRDGSALARNFLHTAVAKKAQKEHENQ
jgi:hypothetical protein